MENVPQIVPVTMKFFQAEPWMNSDMYVSKLYNKVGGWLLFEISCT